MLKLVALALALAACGPETTSFRTTDRSDPADGAALYEAKGATVHVWSNGGYIGSSDEPMTHVGFDIRNTGARPIVFDGDALQLVITGNQGAPLPAARFVTITPLGPSQVTIAPGADVQLDSYYQLPVRPRVVEAMTIRWSLGGGTQITSFVRDDDFPTVSRPGSPEATSGMPST